MHSLRPAADWATVGSMPWLTTTPRQAKNPYAELNPHTQPISAPPQALEPMLIQQWRPSGM